eukprot:CAMPEP_0198252666 /NCGR_PEP_ID=MMETSP1447-20131203/3149_1 /TAXON_ID=420782 /ORGANISM="Chaetoceros dichaeta, Strain CCMP1751" /LENGTH=44 /DNA_ID= /DNA_START= /DNA_END= /DNA_ORIENTATION=
MAQIEMEERGMLDGSELVLDGSEVLVMVVGSMGGGGEAVIACVL